MKKSRSIISILSFSFVLLLMTSNVMAEEDPKIKATYELFEAMKLSDTFGKTITKMLDIQIKQRPAMGPYRQVMLKFFEKYMGWDSLKVDMAKIYASKFSLEEINKLTAFYKTPLGTKMARLTPQLAGEGAALGQRRVQANLGVLKQMIVAETARLKNKK